MMTNRVENCVVTGANSIGRGGLEYFRKGVLTLISSVHKWGYDDVDKILVYDWGLEPDQIEYLNTMDKVEVGTIPDDVKYYFEEMNIDYYRFYGYKTYVMSEIRKHAKNALWMDAGACFCKSPKNIFDIIKNEKMFVVGYDPNWQVTRDGIAPEAFDEYVRIIGATEEELNSLYTPGTFHGCNTDSPYCLIYKEEYKYNRIRKCIYSDNKFIHRHQTLLSIISYRYGVHRQDWKLYVPWGLEGMDAVEGQMLFTHRCQCGDIVPSSNIRIKNNV